MPATLLEGKTPAAHLQTEVAAKVHQWTQQGLRPPHLAVILVGADPASTLYVRNKRLACENVGIRCTIFTLDPLVSNQDLLALVKQLNEDTTVDGILIQLPLPLHLDKALLIDHLDPQKDVDGFHPYNIGLLAQQRPILRPCTPMGIMSLLRYYEIELAGLSATIVGVSDIVGRPMMLELLQAHSTVTACHRLTTNLQHHVKQADLLVVAAGQPHLIPGEWIKKSAIVIDVGMNQRDNGRYIGDVDFEQAKQHAAWITPVPGGVGPMTVASLLQNTLIAYQTQRREKVK